MPKILIVEDDTDLSAVLREWLESQNYSLDIVHDGREGYQYLEQGHYDAVILDWNLPGMTGIEICKKYRATRGTSPILMLTAKDQIVEKEAGLDSGADDYLTKPFSMRELSARLRALTRRTYASVGDILQAGKVSLDPIRHRVWRDGNEVHLLPKDFELLEFLMRHPDQVFSTEALVQRVWNFDADVTSNAVRSSVRRIRRELDESDDEDKSIIENVRRVGYRLRK